METYRIGEIIKEERIRKRISQEELCFGICSVSTLSRIENGTQNPSFKVKEAILERLGHNTDNLVIYAEDSEIKKHRLENEILARMVHWQEIDSLLDEYKQLIANRGTEEQLEVQFYKMAEAIQAFYRQMWEWKRVRKQLTEALRITLPGYEIEQIDDIKLLSGAELQILNNIALTYAKETENDKAIRILEFLVRYLEKGKLNVESPGKYYPVLLCNLVKLYEAENRYREVKICSKKGMDYCISQSRLNSFAEHLFYYGKACHKLGESEEAEVYYKRSISLFESIGRNDAAKEVRSRLNKLDGCIDEGKGIFFADQDC